MKHTPGPWEVGGPYPGVSVIVCLDAGNASGPDPEPPTYEPICILDQRTEGQQNEQALADARLIAAAPDLLAALRLAHRAMEGLRFAGTDQNPLGVRDVIGGLVARFKETA